MRFKLLLIITAFSLSSCGILGSKEKPAAEENKIGGTGCLDNSKDIVGRYVDGKIDREEWKSSFDCINQSLDFFTQYVHGSSENSYSQGDMYTLISKFLITNRPVHRELMRGAFNLKQALFGGDASQFTKAQIELLKTSLTRLQLITADLIPYLKVRQDPNATYQELSEMSLAFKTAGERIADYVEKTLPVGDMSDQALSLLIDQLSQTLDLQLIDGLDRKVFLAKWLMFNTRRDAIEGQDWPQFFRSAMTLGGIVLAFNTAKNVRNPDQKEVMDRFANDYQYREFIWDLILQAKPTITESLTKHNGNTPLPLFDHLIDELPKGYINNLDNRYLKEALRPIVRKLFLSQTQTGVDVSVINTFFGLVENTIKDLGSVDRFYEKTGLSHYDVKSDIFNAAINQYESTLSGESHTRFTNVKNIILSYKPYLYGNDADGDSNSIQYGNDVGYTRLQNILVVTLDRVLNHLHHTYGSGDGYFAESDFRTILDEPSYKEILNSLTWVDKTISLFYHKRFQDIDLFTPISDGNGQVTIPEMIHYALMIVSSGTLATKMRNEITKLCDQGLGQDNMGWTWVPIQCFRNEFYKKLPKWLTYFPRLKAYWETLTPEQQEKAAIWLEHGSRRNGYGEASPQDDWVGKFDFGASATVLHYTESLFTRFDVDNSEVLSKSEVGKAYPVFKKLLYTKSPSKKDYILKGIFTYLVKYRTMPITNTANGITKLGWWLASYTFQKYSTDRSGVFNIVCQLAAPEGTLESDRDALNARICAP